MMKAPFPLLAVGTTLPAAPLPRLSVFGSRLAEQLEPSRVQLATALQAEEDARSSSFEAAKQLQAVVRLATQGVQDGQLDATRTALAAARTQIEALGEVPPQPKRNGAIAGVFEEVVAIEGYIHFFSTGTLLRKGNLPDCFDDEEYLGGGLKLSQTLGEYALQRCLVGDTSSVVLARNVVDALNGELVLFDFRNGNLRRKYDGLKYSKKRLEDLLFEQSLLPDAASSANEQEEPPVKRPKNQEKDAGSAAADEAKAAAQAQGESKPSKDEGGEASTSPSLVDADEMALIRARFEASDAAREIIIKGCRDGQKLAKQAIYSVHRRDFEKASKQAADALSKAAALTSTVETYPTLRPGAYTALLEEYAEAVLFLAFAQEQKVATLDEVLPPAFAVDQAAYLGGLVDLTGEIGRLAVAFGTARAIDDVDRCVEATAVVSTLLSSLPPSNALSKKGNAVATNLRKMTQVQYELNLAKRGRASRTTVVDTNAQQPAAEKEGSDEPGA